jgi:hypothetical protein
MGRKWPALVLVVLGVFLLAGPGWAALTAGMLIYVTPAPTATVRAGRLAVIKIGHLTGVVWRWLITGRRRSLAMVSMPPPLVLIPLGIGMVYGPGWAVATAGILLAAVSLLLGWNVPPRSEFESSRTG